MFYPLMLNIKDKDTTVIGGGKVAFRKVKKLLEYNAKVKVISKEFIEDFNFIKEKIVMIKEEYNKESLENSFLIFACTDSNKINFDIMKYCKENNILCNLADDLESSDFIVPSSIKRGELIISVSTLGKSPSLASKIRKELEDIYTIEYSDYVEVLGDIREILLKKCSDKIKRKKILNELVYLSYEDLLKRRGEYENSSWI